MSYLYYTQTAGVVKIERPTLLVVTKCAKLRFRLNGENCVRSLAPPLPNATAAQPLAALPPYGCGVPLAGASLGCIWVPGGSAPYDPRGPMRPIPPIRGKCPTGTKGVGITGPYGIPFKQQAHKIGPPRPSSRPQGGTSKRGDRSPPFVWSVSRRGDL